MKLSTKSRYGTRALLELALHRRNEPVKMKEISQNQQISKNYLEHVISPLISAGIVRSTRGSKGGLFLVKKPEDIKLSEVIKILEGSVGPVECVDEPEVCNRSGFCVTRDVWIILKESIEEVLKSITLQDLVERHKEKQQSEPAMYNI